MDTRTGIVYPSHDAAIDAGAREEDLVDVPAYYPGPKRCGRCKKPVKVRKSTPTKTDGKGLVWVWCNKCWFVKGAA